MTNLNVLFNLHSYNSFNKLLVDSIAKYVNSINVFVRFKPIASYLSFLPIQGIKNHNKEYVFNYYNKPENIIVFPVNLFYLPTLKGYKKLGGKHFNAVSKIIKRRNIEFDIIHSVFSWTAGFVGSELKKKYNKKFVLTEYRSDLTIIKNDKERELEITNIWKNADFITRNSSSTIDIIKKYNPNTEVLYNGYSPEMFYYIEKLEARKKLSLSCERKIILNVGYLEEYKGHKYLIESVYKLIKIYPDILCIIIGDGTKRNSLQNTINRYNLNNNVIMVGQKKYNELVDWINAADLFVMPSLTEGNPTIMFESLACGKPFVGTKVGGIPEIIINENYGILCENEDAYDLASKIDKALNMKWDKITIMNYATNFTWDLIAKRYIEIYKDLLEI